MYSESPFSPLSSNSHLPPPAMALVGLSVSAHVCERAHLCMHVIMKLSINALVILWDRFNHGAFLPLASLLLPNCYFEPLLQLGHVFDFTKRKQRAFSGKAKGFQCSPNTDAQEMGDSCGSHIGNFSAKILCPLWEAPLTPHCPPGCLTPNVPWNNSTSYLRYGPASLNHQLLDCTTNRLYKRILRKNKIMSTV